jgi:hypothetical protein
MDLMIVAHKRELMQRDEAVEQQNSQWQERLTQLEARVAAVMLILAGRNFHLQQLRPSERAAHCMQAGAAELSTQASTIEQLEAAAAQQELGLRTALENVQEAGEGTAVALLGELVHTLPYLYLDVTNMHLQPCRDVTRCPFGMDWPPDML